LTKFNYPTTLFKVAQTSVFRYGVESRVSSISVFMFCTISIIGVRSGCLCDIEQAAGCLHPARNEREQDRRDERGAGDSTKDDGGVS
jgi:hypothetical protein